MSQICIGKVEEIAKEDASQYETEVKRIMEKYGYGIFPVDWYEPLTELFDCLFFSIGDIHWGDCEQLYEVHKQETFMDLFNIYSMLDYGTW